MAGTRVLLDPRATKPPAEYDPLTFAARPGNQPENLEANVPPLCYTRTDGISNPCAACHTHSTYPNLADDWELQQNYYFSAYAKVNHWKNLFRDRVGLVTRFTDDEILAYVRADNYAPLRAWLAAHPTSGVPGPDLDLAQGFDAGGFARDGDDVFVRLSA